MEEVHDTMMKTYLKQKSKDAAIFHFLLSFIDKKYISFVCVFLFCIFSN